MGSLDPKWVIAALGCVAAMGGAPANAQWPAGQVRIVVPYPPGTEPDVMARDIGQRLSHNGNVVVIENRPGANGMIGTAAVAKAAADGHTLLMIDRLALVTNPMLYSTLPYDPKTDIKPVAEVGKINLLVAVRQNFPGATYKDFVAYSKTAPGKTNVGTGGNGHVNHLGMEMLAQSENIQFSYVPYKGVAPAINALLAGEVDAVMAGGLVMSQHAGGGRIKVLAVGDTTRSAFLPEVPTLGEAGGKPGAIPSTVFMLAAPGKTPASVLDQANAAINKVLADPELQGSYRKRGVELLNSTPASSQDGIQRETVVYDALMKRSPIKLQ